MKKRLVALPLVLIVALVLACLLMPGASAVMPVPEAQLVTTPANGTATTESGTLDEMVQKLNASVSPEAATTYELKLLTDAVQTVPAVLTGNGNATVTVMLDGHTLASGTTSDLYTVNGLADFKFVGGFTRGVELGCVVSDKISGALLAIPAGAVAKAEISDVNIEYSGLNPDGSVLNVGAGAVRLRNANITYTGKGNALGASDTLSLIKVGKASLALTLSGVKDASATGVVTAISADGATLRVERGEINAEYAFNLSGDVFANLIDPDITASLAVFTAPETETDNIVNTAGVRINAPHIISGGVGKEDVKLWYGTGSTYVVGVDPANEATLATSETSIKAIGSAYTLTHSFTSTAILTTMADGRTPTEATNEFKYDQFNQVAPDVPTAYILAFLKDYTFTKGNASMTDGHENSTVFIDYNGKNILFSYKNSNVMLISGAFKFLIDGADAEGNRATVSSSRTTGAILRDMAEDENSLFAISGCHIVFKDGRSASSMLQLCSGFSYIYNNKFTYTGELVDTAPTSENYIRMLDVSNTSKSYVYDCEFNHASTVENINTKALRMSGGALSYCYAKNLKINTTCAVDMYSTKSGAKLYLADSDVATTAVPYSANSANAPLYITDTVTRSPVTEVATGYTYFLFGSGKNRVITATGEVSGGKFEEGFGFCLTGEENVFVVGTNNISLDQIFTSGMVLQAGKPANVYGTSLAEGSTVTVKVGDLATATAVVTDGKWCATFENLPYATDVDIVVTDDVDGSMPTVVYNIDIGEIWVMSGQSNSVYDVTDMEDYDEYLALADNYKIKAYIMPQGSSMVEGTETEAKWHTIDKAWLTSQAKNDKNGKAKIGLSAIAYVMATRLAVELPEGVTVAIIDANVNGSNVQTWMDYDVAKTYAPSYAEIYKAYYDAYVENGNVYPTEEQMKEKGITTGYIASGKQYSKMPTACYNCMVAPLEGFCVKGTIWYQGEGNGDSVTETSDGGYTDCWRAVRESFRKAFGGDENLPMFVIQIPQYFQTHSELKALQCSMVEEDDNCYVVSNTLEGPVFSTEDLHTSSMSDSMVHYARKSPMGIALAASILENIYGKSGLAAPKVLSVEADGSSIKITLDRDFEVAWGEEIVGFELAGADGVYKTASAVADGRTITLTAPGVIAPKAVRYGFGTASFEMEDGRVLTLDRDLYTYTATAIDGSLDSHGKQIYNVTITEKATGDVLYTFTSDDTQVVRCRGTGNVVATNGQTLPVFKITVG